MQFLDLLSTAARIMPEVAPLLEKTLAAYVGVCVDNNDPDGQRRIRVTTAASPDTMSWWAQRIAEKGNDDPLPALGDTVLLLAVDGDENNTFYTPMQNLTNPALAKASPQDDRYTHTVGDVKHTTDAKHSIIAKDDVLVQTEAEAVYEAEQLTTIKTGAAVSIVITPTSITLTAPIIYLAGTIVQTNYAVGVPSSATFKGNLAITDAVNVSINTKQVLTIGSVDDDGDISVVKGW